MLSKSIMRSSHKATAVGVWIGRLSLLTLMANLVACSSPTTETPSDVVSSPTETTSPAATPATGATSPPITDPTLLSTIPIQPALANRRVEFTGVTVKAALSNGSFWIGQKNPELLVIPGLPSVGGKPAQLAPLKAGQKISLAGVLKPMITSEQIQQQWKLSEKDAKALSRLALYLQADKITL